MSDAWSKLCDAFGDARRSDAEGLRPRALDPQLQRQQTRQTRSAVQQLMIDLFTIAEQRARDLERRTGTAVRVGLHQPPASASGTLLSWVSALKLSLGDAVVYVYAFRAPDAGIYLHLLPYHRASIRQGRRLLSELAASVVPGEGGTYQLRLLTGGEAAGDSSELLLRAFRLLLQITTGETGARS